MLLHSLFLVTATFLVADMNVVSNDIQIVPIMPNEYGEYRYIGFKVMAPWIDGYVRVRFPENVISGLGWHFLDHSHMAPDLEMISDFALPAWRKDPVTDKWDYVVETEEGVHFGGQAYIEDNTIAMVFWVENHTGAVLPCDSQICIDMQPSPTLNEKNTLGETHTWFDGMYQSLEQAHASNSKLYETGYNWVLMLIKGNPDTNLQQMEKDHPWWIVEEMADYPIIARETPDGEHLFAVAFYDGCRRLMTNTNIPCLHVDPQHVAQLEDGARAVWRGRLFLMENDSVRLLEAFNKYTPTSDDDE